MANSSVLPFEALANPDDWVKASSRKDCSMCFIKFSTFKRRHHCRVVRAKPNRNVLSAGGDASNAFALYCGWNEQCGDIVCGTCFVKRKASIPMVGVIDVKVCSSCANNERQIRASLAKASSGSIDDGFSASVDNRSTIGDSRSSTFLKPASDTSSTYSSSIFSVSSFDLGYSPKRRSSLHRDDTIGDEIGSDLPLREMKDIQAKWLKMEELHPLRQLSANTARYDIWVMRHQDGEMLVSKRLNTEHVTGESIEQFIDVIELAAQLRHPHIVDFMGVAWTAGHRIQALYEYLPRGDLRTFLDATARDAKTRQEKSRHKLQMALDIAEALVHLHSFSPPLVHGSLDSGEVFLTKDYRAKLGGIGATSLDRAGKKSRRWQAPEVIGNAGVYLTSSDVYAFGVILCELDTHQIPYADCLDSQGEPLPEDEIEQMVASGDLQPTISRDSPPELRSLASDCMAFDPKDRPTAVEITVRLRMFIRSYGLESSSAREDKKYDLGFSASARSRSEGLTF